MNAEMYHRMAATIIELQAAAEAEMDARSSSALAHHFQLRRLLDAKKAIAQLAKELK